MRIILCDDDTVFTQVFEKRLLTVFKKYGITPEIVSAHTAWKPCARLHAGRRMCCF